MWNYIYFALHLDAIDPNSHNALEKYVYENVSLNFFASFTCIVILYSLKKITRDSFHCVWLKYLEERSPKILVNLQYKKTNIL